MRVAVSEDVMALRIALLLALLTSLASARPSWVGALSDPHPGHHPLPGRGEFVMRLSWNGLLDAGTIRVEADPEPRSKRIWVRSHASSRGAAALIHPYRSDSSSEIDSVTLLPRRFHDIQTDRHESVTVTTRHFENHVESVEITKSKASGKEKRVSNVFRFSPVFDLYSAWLHVRSKPLADGDRLSLAMVPYDTPYLLDVRVEGRDIHQGRNAIRMKVGLRKIDPHDLTLKPHRKLKREVTLWLSDDDRRIPLEFRASVFIGDIRATLAPADSK
jgi:hypothetical protein